MSLKHFYTLFLLLFLGFIFLNNSGGRAADGGWGSTGAPGEDYPTCIFCHHGLGDFSSPTLNLYAQNGTLVEDGKYLPGTTYNMEVIIESNENYIPEAYGFQMTALINQGSVEANNWSNISDNVQIADIGRTYIEHNGPSTSNTFTMDWTAPDAGMGKLTFYLSGTVVNNDGTDAGDGASISSTRLFLDEAIPNAITDQNTMAIQLNVSPNPATDMIHVDIDTPIQADFMLNILSLSGQLLHRQSWSSSNNSIDVADLPQGMYFVQLINQSSSTSTKWVKL